MEGVDPRGKAGKGEGGGGADTRFQLLSSWSAKS